MNDSTKSPDPILAANFAGVKVPGPPRRAGGSTPRRQGDTYETPDPLALAICRRLLGLGLFPRNILEPSAGHGAFVRAASATWPQATVAAIEPREECLESLRAAGAAVLAARLEDAGLALSIGVADLVLGNPPYSHAEEHVELLLGWMEPGAVLAFLLRLPFLGGDRDGLLSRWIPTAVWPVVPRPSFTGDGETEKIEYAVVVWVKGKGDARIFGRVAWEK